MEVVVEGEKRPGKEERNRYLHHNWSQPMSCLVSEDLVSETNKQTAAEAPRAEMRGKPAPPKHLR